MATVASGTTPDWMTWQRQYSDTRTSFDRWPRMSGLNYDRNLIELQQAVTQMTKSDETSSLRGRYQSFAQSLFRSPHSPRMFSRALKDPTIIIAALTSTLIAVAFLFATFSIASKVQSNCQAINNLKGLIAQSILTSAGKLGSPGTAGYAYYLQHPQELAAAKQQLLLTIKEYNPSQCN